MESNHTSDAPGSAAKRLAWFIGLWAAGVVTLGVIAYGIRFVFTG